MIDGSPGASVGEPTRRLCRSIKLTSVSETVAFVICNDCILWVSWLSSSCGGGRRCKFNHGGIAMNKKLLSCLIAGALATTLALAAPAFARGGGGGHGGGHGGGFGGGHFGGGGMHFGGGGAHFSGGRWGGMGGGSRFAAAHWGGAHWSGMNRGVRFAHAGFSPRFSRFAFHHRFHHRFDRFAFAGAPYLYASYYDDCWRTAWTRYGLQWVNVCGDYY
jgi:hypothetical protein